tara:strand:+ start:493 stop:1326 length:834 start_codon:yes stop_codon:yes gene_type:complete
MRRNNEERLLKGHKPTPTEEASLPNPMDFVRPSQFVDLPSKGNYPHGHPLHGCESIEINYMTAKDEDILTNKSLLRKGLAIDNLIQNLIKDKSINGRSMYLGDRNAILVYARASAYGEDYKTKMQCPACETVSKTTFDLSEHETYTVDVEDNPEIKDLHDGTYQVTLPASGIVTTIKPLTGQDELQMLASEKSKDRTNNLITKQMKQFVVDFNGYDDESTIYYVVDNMVAKDSRYLRKCHDNISPDIVMRQEFECKNCGHKEVVSVPFGTDFFWPES